MLGKKLAGDKYALSLGAKEAFKRLGDISEGVVRRFHAAEILGGCSVARVDDARRLKEGAYLLSMGGVAAKST